MSGLEWAFRYADRPVRLMMNDEQVESFHNVFLGVSVRSSVRA